MTTKEEMAELNDRLELMNDKWATCNIEEGQDFYRQAVILIMEDIKELMDMEYEANLYRQTRNRKLFKLVEKNFKKSLTS